MSLNPYERPAAELPLNVQGDNTPRTRAVRVVIYLHIAAIACSGVVFSPALSATHWQPMLVYLFFIPGLAGFFLCPIALLVAVLQSRDSLAWRFTYVAVGIGLSMTHAFALLPGVQ